jgi:hypothetical protein
MNATRSCLTVWESHAHATAIKADPSYPTFIQDREALATAPVYEVHVPFSGNPQRAFEAPVTEVDDLRADDREVNPDAMSAAEVQEGVRRSTLLMESYRLQGSIATSSGVAIEDGRIGVYLTGWRTVEVRHSFAHARALLSRPLHSERLNSFLTGPHAFWHVR